MYGHKPAYIEHRQEHAFHHLAGVLSDGPLGNLIMNAVLIDKVITTLAAAFPDVILAPFADYYTACILIEPL